MSGGRFDYKQYVIDEIADDIEMVLNKQGKEKNRDELFASDDFYKKYPEEKYHETYPIEVQEIFKTAIEKLMEAAIYTKRIDFYLSGDNGQEDFIKRLKEELNG